MSGSLNQQKNSNLQEDVVYNKDNSSNFILSEMDRDDPATSKTSLKMRSWIKMLDVNPKDRILPADAPSHNFFSVNHNQDLDNPSYSVSRYLQT